MYQRLKYTLLLGLAYVFCYTLTSIFDLPLSKAEAKQRLRAWKQIVQKSEVDCFASFLSTLDKRLEEITNYFVDRKNSGFVEGLNNKYLDISFLGFLAVKLLKIIALFLRNYRSST